MGGRAMAEDLSRLKTTWLFEARQLHGAANLTEQRDWLWAEYQKIKEGGLSEVTAHSFNGQSGAAQYRGASPQDNLQALQAAIEELEGLIAGAVASNFAKPFGFRFLGTPAEILG